jgi:YD repeat-containing protein
MLTTALGQTTAYEIRFADDGSVERSRIDPSGAATVVTAKSDGSRHYVSPDGTIVDGLEGPDPRWRMQAPILKALTATTPGGMTTTMAGARAATLTNQDDPFSMTGLTSTLTVDGQTYTTVYDAATRTETLTAPSGRTTTRTFDARGRMVALTPDQTAGMVRSRGRSTRRARDRVARADQAWTWEYDAGGRAVARTDALGDRLEFGYDAADRRTSVKLPSAATWTLGWDAAGSLAQVTPPAGDAHVLGYDGFDEEAAYTPPGGGAFQRQRDRGKALHRRASGGRESFAYDASDRFGAHVSGGDGHPDVARRVHRSSRLNHPHSGGGWVGATGGPGLGRHARRARSVLDRRSRLRLRAQTESLAVERPRRRVRLLRTTPMDSARRSGLHRYPLDRRRRAPTTDGAVATDTIRPVASSRSRSR